jgi:hypothetical protein
MEPDLTDVVAGSIQQFRYPFDPGIRGGIASRHDEGIATPSITADRRGSFSVLYHCSLPLIRVQPLAP